MSATKVLTEAILKGLLPGVLSNTGTIGDEDLDTVTEPGTYQISNNTQLPSNMNPWSYLVVIAVGQGIVQIGVDSVRGALYFRGRWNKTTLWKGWWKVTGTAVT